MRYPKHGFTLIELIIVIVIIGVLASIAAPMMGGMKVKAICAEAVTGMSALRTAMRAYYVETGKYPAPWYIVSYGTEEAFEHDFPGLGPRSNLTGTYFSYESYYVDGTKILCWMNISDILGQTYKNNAPRADEADKCKDLPGGQLQMRVRDGRISQTGVSRSGYPPYES